MSNIFTNFDSMYPLISAASEGTSEPPGVYKN